MKIGGVWKTCGYNLRSVHYSPYSNKRMAVQDQKVVDQSHSKLFARLDRLDRREHQAHRG